MLTLRRSAWLVTLPVGLAISCGSERFSQSIPAEGGVDAQAVGVEDGATPDATKLDARVDAASEASTTWHPVAAPVTTRLQAVAGSASRTLRKLRL